MNHIQETIQKIDGVNLKKDNANELLHQIISNELQKLPTFALEMEVGEPLVRARPLEDDEEFHHLIQDYSYNPWPEKIKIGRANHTQQQVFYGARFRETALREVRFIYANREKQEARYSLGRWEVKAKLKLACIVTPDQIRRFNATELMELAEFIEDTNLKLKNDLELAGFIDIYEYMAKKFTEAIQEGDENKYKITAVFSNFIYNRLAIADGILYQSVQLPQHFNVVLKKEVVDQRKIQLTFAARQRYVRTNGLNYEEAESIETTNIDYSSGRVLWEQ